MSEPAVTTSAGTRGDAPAPAVELVRLRKHFGDVKAVHGVDLAIGDGEFFSMLGPSGSGKTTVLRLIAGFEQPDAGAILLHGRDVARLAPYERDVNTVFQDYALFPHMTVQENVEYGLKVKRVERKERRRRAREMLETVRLAEYGARRPTQLSGGQRQRVALARALVNRPKVLLLDEPLGALDLKLREEMQVELKAIQHEVSITFVFVTHDQGEALSMSDRVAVFNGGRVEQVGTPKEIYECPATAFVAGFVGVSNMIRGETARQLLGSDASFVVRPERISVQAGGHTHEGTISTTATVRDVQYLGADVRVHAVLPDGTRVIAVVPASSITDVSVGREVTLAWPANAAFALAGAERDSVNDDWGDEP
ncbi:MAG: ABC transporter ATP-binding protein [Acidimicrobiia bacterium]